MKNALYPRLAINNMMKKGYKTSFLHRNVVQPKLDSYWINQSLNNLLPEVLIVNITSGVKLTLPRSKPRVKDEAFILMKTRYSYISFITRLKS